MIEFARTPKVFISYAWEDDIKLWVRDLATRLRSDGVDTILELIGLLGEILSSPYRLTFQKLRSEMAEFSV